MIADLAKESMFSEDELMAVARRIGDSDSERTCRIVGRLCDMAVAVGMRPDTLPGAFVQMLVNCEGDDDD